MKQSYIKVLEALRSGTPKTSAEISAETGLEYMDVVGAVSILRRQSLLAQAGEKRYRVTDKGRMLFDARPGIEVDRRQT